VTRLSVGIPVYNEAAVAPELIRRVMAVIDNLPGGPHEVIFVDDGSTDGTRPLLAAAAARDPRITVLALSRNFGHQAALCAALDFARGDAVVLMDGDLQDEPELIPELVRRHEGGADVVYARRASRQEGLLLRACYALFYRVVGALSDVPLQSDAGDFALLGPPVIAAIRRLPERERYLRGLRAWVGFRQEGIDVNRPARRLGNRKYTTWKLLKLALDGICSFSVIPLRAVAIAGLVAIAGAVAFSIYALYVRLAVGAVPRGFTASLLITTLLSGVQLLSLGVIGEYLGRVYTESKSRPTYIVAAVVGRDDGSP
jgi:polyisoprenyl-phosphate glycosyltransferase